MTDFPAPALSNSQSTGKEDIETNDFYLRIPEHQRVESCVPLSHRLNLSASRNQLPVPLQCVLRVSLCFLWKSRDDNHATMLLRSTAVSWPTKIPQRLNNERTEQSYPLNISAFDLWW